VAVIPGQRKEHKLNLFINEALRKPEKDEVSVKRNKISTKAEHLTLNSSFNTAIVIKKNTLET
jgi:hypothetical protein